MLAPQQFDVVTNRMSREQAYTLAYETHAALLKVLGLIGHTLPPNPEDIPQSAENAAAFAKAFVLLAALANLQDVAVFEQKVAKELVLRSAQMDGLE